MIRYLSCWLLLISCLGSGAADVHELYERARTLAEQNQDLNEAIRLFAQVVSQAKAERALGARAQYEQGLLYERLGRTAEARRAFRAVLRDFGDQPAVAALARAKLPPGAAEPGIAVRQIWAGPGVDSFGSASSDGKYLSFTQWPAGDLAIREIATGDSRRLTSPSPPGSEPGGTVMQSQFSPDGKRLAYVRFVSQRECEVRVIGVDGTGERTVYAPGPGVVADLLDWTPDGRSLLIILNDGLAVVSLRDGTRRMLKLPGWSEGRVKYSRDGRFIAYESNQAGNTAALDISLIRVDGSQAVPVVQHLADDRLLGWSPGDTHILFLSDRSGSWDIWEVPIANGAAQDGPRRIKPDAGPMYPMGISRSGTLFYAAPTNFADVFTAELDIARGAIIAPPMPVNQRFTGNKSTPAWSPDGRSLVYLSTPFRGRAMMSVVPLASGEERDFYPQLRRMVSVLQWAPPGGSLIVTGVGFDKKFGIYRVSVENGAATFLAGQFTDRPVVSPDGKTAYYGSPATPVISSRNLETGETKVLWRHANPRAFRNPNVSVSWDGKRVAVTLVDVPAPGSQSLAVMPADGGEPKVLFTVNAPEHFGANAHVWSLDGAYLVAATNRDNVAQFWRIRADGAAPADKLPISMRGAVRALRLHPDGRRIAFLSGSFEGDEIWAMENLIRPLHGR